MSNWIVYASLDRMRYSNRWDLWEFNLEFRFVPSCLIDNIASVRNVGFPICVFFFHILSRLPILRLI